MSWSTETFYQFFLSIDGMLGREALAVLANLSRIMAEKIDVPILHLRGWIYGRIKISVVRSYSCMIHKAQLISSLRDRSRTGTRHWASDCHIKLRSTITSCAHPQTIFRHPCELSLPSSFTHHARTPEPKTETTYSSRLGKYFRLRIRNISV